MNKQIGEKISFYRPTLVGTEGNEIQEVLKNGRFGGNNAYTEKCHHFFKSQYNFKNSFLIHSCSLALEMAANLCCLKSNDEVIVPSYAYITDASSFVKTGAKVVFVDSMKTLPHISGNSIRKKITPKTKVLLVVHYGGIACNMEEMIEIAQEFNLILIEDCAQAIHVKYKDKYLGTFGHMSTFSFHETKNIQCGEGGLLVINDENLLKEAKQMWNEGTNKNDFIEKKVSFYEWTTLGSSYQPSEITAAFLYHQLNRVEEITSRRKIKWKFYFENLFYLQQENKIELPQQYNDCFNAHTFYIKLKSKKEREKVIVFLKENEIVTAFHFLPLHKSAYWLKNESKDFLPNAENWSDCLLRLPLYDSISEEEQRNVINAIKYFYSI